MISTRIVLFGFAVVSIGLLSGSLQHAAAQSAVCPLTANPCPERCNRCRAFLTMSRRQTVCAGPASLETSE